MDMRILIEIVIALSCLSGFYIFYDKGCNKGYDEGRIDGIDFALRNPLKASKIINERKCRNDKS